MGDVAWSNSNSSNITPFALLRKRSSIRASLHRVPARPGSETKLPTSEIARGRGRALLGQPHPAARCEVLGGCGRSGALRSMQSLGGLGGLGGHGGLGALGKTSNFSWHLATFSHSSLNFRMQRCSEAARLITEPVAGSSPAQAWKGAIKTRVIRQETQVHC